MDVDVVVDAHPAWRSWVTERRHHRPRALRLKLEKEEPSEASLSWTSPHHPHLTCWK
jgi:hypothetical protein